MPAALTAAPAIAATAAVDDNFQRYYEEAGPDYAAWSPAFNMHFGFFRRGMNPFNREAMLEQMNLEVLDRLHLSSSSTIRPRILDMGCGLGATLRSFARHLPSADLHGVTLVPWQLEQGRLLNHSAPHAGNITMALGDYEHTPYPSASFDAVCAIESSCYSNGVSKSRLIREAHRLLRPGGRLVVADAFLGPGRLRGPQHSIYRTLCDCWAIDTMADIDSFTRELRRAGFVNIRIEPMRARVAPSALHIPWVTIKFLLTSVVFGRRTMTRARWNNVLAPLLLPLVVNPLGPLDYLLVSATRI